MEKNFRRENRFTVNVDVRNEANCLKLMFNLHILELLSKYSSRKVQRRDKAKRME